MKLICYGASVTAQKSPAGYFYYLKELLENENTFKSYDKVAFGASQFEFAGYGFIEDVLKADPDVCIIDWLTPSMKQFSQYKVELLNRVLLQKSCLPIWVSFPRRDNYHDLPASYFQFKDTADAFSVPFIDVFEDLKDFSKNTDHYIRDIVHTTPEGAKAYANSIAGTLVKLDVNTMICNAKKTLAFEKAVSDDHAIPKLYAVEGVIKNGSNLEIFMNWAGGRFEVFFETEVGPHVCKMKFRIYKENELFDEQVFNPADPWCHYTRKMIFETLRTNLSKGEYKIIVSKIDEEPFQEIETKKPRTEFYDIEERYFSFKRVSVSGDVTLSLTNNEE